VRSSVPRTFSLSCWCIVRAGACFCTSRFPQTRGKLFTFLSIFSPSASLSFFMTFPRPYAVLYSLLCLETRAPPSPLLLIRLVSRGIPFFVWSFVFPASSRGFRLFGSVSKTWPYPFPRPPFFFFFSPPLSSSIGFEKFCSENVLAVPSNYRLWSHPRIIAQGPDRGFPFRFLCAWLAPFLFRNSHRRVSSAFPRLIWDVCGRESSLILLLVWRSEPSHPVFVIRDVRVGVVCEVLPTTSCLVVVMGISGARLLSFSPLHVGSVVPCFSS